MSATAFKVTLLNKQGVRERRVVEAPTEADAFRRVAAEGSTPLSITAIERGARLFSFQLVGSSDIASLTRELAVLVEARIPLARGLATIAEHESKDALRELVHDLAAKVEAGMAFSAAVESHRGVFGETYVQTLKAAEKSGNLIAVMNHLADLLEQQLEQRQQFKRAMAYPAVVLSVVVAALTIIFVFVVPKFAATFAHHNVQLPLATRIVQAIGESAREHWYVYLGALTAALISVVMSWRSSTGRLVCERVLLGLPFLGKMLVAGTTARFSRVLSIGLTSGLDVIQSIDAAGRSTGRPVFILECERMGERLRQGEQLGEVVRESRYLPGFARRMIAAGKDSTELARASDIVARHYDRELSHLTKGINSIIEPILTVALAVIVLVVALSVFLPMWQMVRIQR
ncbi:MAG: type II secretion system F family protein [Planctomycetota bacterium]|nr:type II secretion system F family protein [Planctomycetota bacterium]